MSKEQDYTVTEKAGDFVAGRRSPGAEKTIRLTPAEAEHDLILGNLVDPLKKQTRKPKTPATEPPAVS